MPLLPLDTFRSILGYHPFWFWGLANNTSLRPTSACNGPVKQYAWQSADASGRHEIAQAIETAEDKLRLWLRYSVAPRYTSETVDFPRYHDLRQWYSSYTGSDGRWMPVQLGEGELRAVGTEARTLLGTPALTYDDTDGDGINDTFTATLATALTDTSEIAVYFAAADRLDSEAVNERWRVQPVQVAISGGVLTIRGRAWLAVKPIKYEGAATQNLDPDTAGNFVGTLEVYRRYTDGQTQGALTWESAPGCVCSAITYSGDPASIATATIRVGIRNAQLGIVTPAEASYDTSSGVWGALDWDACRPPDRVTINYYAGVELLNNARNEIALQWQQVVARMAMAELAGPICACSAQGAGVRELHHWQFDLARAAGANDEQYQIAAGDLENPFGTRRGHVHAWNMVKHLRQVRGFLS